MPVMAPKYSKTWITKIPFPLLLYSAGSDCNDLPPVGEQRFFGGNQHDINMKLCGQDNPISEVQVQISTEPRVRNINLRIK